MNDKVPVLSEWIRDIPDFPKPGINFKDITPLLGNAQALAESVRQLAAPFRGEQIDHLVAVEARGFLFGAPVAIELGVGVVPVRKPGKLPGEIRRFEYDLEYGSDALEIHIDSIEPGDRVLVVDDLLATGGTVQACCELLEQCGAVVMACAFLIDLTFLNGAERLAPRSIFSVIQY
jgi:adenine phosphoribosyltransferase